ncbi:hypothetical protein FSP39_007392 [Pinctada imbricata]|uniref:Uncharacterized protein n=1 Tax=Pinctada imbricata TaxID=66713 RepID=A0AA89BQS7_PINIB|nr:hypothetical protein FSP39_007392 [Pinctada imbricata]
MGVTKENVKEVLRAIFVIPFIAGNALPYDEFHTGTREMDGSLSSTVTIACLTSVIFVIIGVYTAKAEIVTKARYIMWSLNCTLIIFGMVALGMISVLAYKNRSTWFVRPSRGHGDWNLKGKFLWVFGLAVILDTSFNLASNIQCISNSQYTGYHIAFASQDLIYITFFSIQLAFLTYFRNFKFESSVRINYGILMVLLVNLCLWFHAVVADTNIEIQDYMNQTKSNNTDLKEMVCVFNSTIKKFQGKILRYLIPARIEAALLSTSFLLSMWPSIRDNTMFSLQPMSSNDFDVDERQPLLTGTGNGNAPTAHASRRHPASFFASMLYGTSINIIMVVSTLVFVFAFENQERSRRDMYPVWRGILISYKFSMLIMVLIVFRIFAKYGEDDDSESNLTATEYILIFSSAGAAASYTFEFIGALQIPESENTIKGMILADSALDIITKYLQTILIISFKDALLRRYSGCISLEYLYVLLAVSNFLLWCGNSFVNVNLSSMNFPNEKNGGLFGHDSKINSFNRYVLNPIIIFYDFHASMDLFEMYMKLRNR